VPLVAVGLFYRRGYVDQRMTAAGEQHAAPLVNDPRDLMVDPVTDTLSRLRRSRASPAISSSLAMF
jgi:glucan phosphorylase